MNLSALRRDDGQGTGQGCARAANTHRFAGFAVLKSPNVPSVLVELGYLSNRKDEKLLKQRSHHDKGCSRPSAGAWTPISRGQAQLSGRKARGRTINSP